MRFSDRMLLAAIVGAVMAGSVAFSLLAGSEQKAGTGAIRSESDQSMRRHARLVRSVPKDAIPPLDFPKYIESSRAPYMKDEEFVVGYIENNDARAYPIMIMNWHEVVNDVVGRRPIVISYCPLCRSGIVFDRRLGEMVLSFGNTGALYESDLVMYDRETGSYWWQVGGLGLKGPLEGRRLTVLPSLTATWREWRNLYPKTLVLSRETGYNRNYDYDPFVGYDDPSSPPAYPVSVRDARLLPKEKVLGLEFNGVSKAYSLSRSGNGVLNDRVAESSIVVFKDGKTGSGAIFDPVVNGEELIFLSEMSMIRDTKTGSTWNLGGRAVAGPLQGRMLRQIPSVSTYWFSWVAAHPDTSIG